MGSDPFSYFPGRSESLEEDGSAFREFDATELYCNHCRRPVPVRKRLLLVLPDGDKYEYLCAFCSGSVGTKIDRHQDRTNIIV